MRPRIVPPARPERGWLTASPLTASRNEIIQAAENGNVVLLQNLPGNFTPLNDALAKAIDENMKEVVQFIILNSPVDSDSSVVRRSIKQSESGDMIKILMKIIDMDDDFLNEILRESVLRGRYKVVSVLLQDERVDPSSITRIHVQYFPKERSKERTSLSQTRTAQLLLQDPRFNWRLYVGTPLEYLLDERKQAFRNSLLPILGGFRDKSALVGGKQASLEYGRRTALEQGMALLCEDLRDGAITSVELVDLIRMLRVARYIDAGEEDELSNNRDKRYVCARIREALTQFQLDQSEDTSQQKKRRLG